MVCAEHVGAHDTSKQQVELTPVEFEVIQVLAWNSPSFTTRTLGRTAYMTEDQVRTVLTKLGLENVISKEQTRERRKIQALHQEYQMKFMCGNFLPFKLYGVGTKATPASGISTALAHLLPPKCAVLPGSLTSAPSTMMV